MSRRVVAVDVGNSAIKLSVVSSVDRPASSASRPTDSATGRPAYADGRITIDQVDWESSVVGWVRDTVGLDRVCWRLAAVHRRAAWSLGQAIRSVDPAARVDEISRHDVPMRLRVDHPDRLGIDRVLGAHAARRRFGQPLVVVDAGSAVTVDWVDRQGDFCGGAILPGLRLQLGALATGTDALPRVDGDTQRPLQAPGKNTAEAIRLGVLTGIAATIDRLANQYAEGDGGDAGTATMVLTGGDAETIARLLKHSHHITENLVCRGLLDLPRSDSELPRSSGEKTNRGEELE